MQHSCICITFAANKKTMMRYLHRYFLAFLISGLLLACSDDEDVDNSPPVVSKVTLNGQATGISVNPGTTMVLEAVFEDDIELGEYKIDIHNNFDGHSHGRTKAPFFFSKSYTLTGTSETVQQELHIPEGSTPGEYHFQLQYIDAAGNEGEIVVMEFEIADPANQPTLTITSPDMSRVLDVAAGKNIIVAGTAADPDGLAEVHILIQQEEVHNHGRLGQGEASSIFALEIPLKGESTWTFHETITVPAEVSPGHYELSIAAEDLAGYRKIVAAELHID